MSSPLELIRQKTILFLTTKEYSHAPSISDPYSEPANIASIPVQNKAFAEALSLAGADVRFSSWRFPAAASTRATLCRFDIILFLCCDGYVQYIEDFLRFLDQTLIPLQDALPRLRIVNDTRVVRWNATGGYLRELQDAQFRMYRTKYLPRAGCDVAEFQGAVEAFASGIKKPLVLKPSLGASGLSSHIIQDPMALTKEDLEQMETMLGLPDMVRSIMIQEIPPTARKLGEYSLVYVGTALSHAVLRRSKEGGTEGRANNQHSGKTKDVAKDDLPKGAIEVGDRLCSWLERKFGKGSVGYMRLDGVLAEDDVGFVIGEVDLIEPEVWLTGGGGQQRVEAFVKCLLDEGA